MESLVSRKRGDAGERVQVEESRNKRRRKKREEKMKTRAVTQSAWPVVVDREASVDDSCYCVSFTFTLPVSFNSVIKREEK